ncbi:PAS-domain containing protein [Paracoccus sp. (in: a-proteobacteria)]|uniref:PAS-domain containing protein n=1 Tax=Paracoccus sp. TaxID=267 RepID=UPI00321F747C
MAVQFLIALAAAALALLPVLVMLPQFGRRAGRAAARTLVGGPEPIVFLFRQQHLVDATPPARALLATLPGEGDWQRLLAWLGMRLPDFAAALPDLGGEIRLATPTGAAPLHACAELVAPDLLRLTLADATAENAGITVDSLSLAAMEQELEILRSTMDHSPMLAWRQDGQGQITWANSAYLGLAEARAAGVTLWPLPLLIDLTARPLPGSPAGGAARRAHLELDGQSRWFDCHTHEIAGQAVTIALPADAAVRAERSLREFVQTLTKTFADLPIGLAIFDRERNLQLFNPALIDLTGLAAGFLTARPTLYAFLDRLREARMVPEPKDYRSWRNQMSSLEAAAASGHHVETWSLPGGQTYRVTGRPHPDGAVAFLFEDITSEISLTRKFRADLRLGAEVLDALPDAVAVFAANGELLMQNRRYAGLWGEASRGTLLDHLAQWTTACGDSPGLAALHAALQAQATDQPLQGAMAGPSGGLLAWGVRGLSGGRVLVSFALPVPAIAQAQMRSQAPGAAAQRVLAG